MRRGKDLFHERFEASPSRGCRSEAQRYVDVWKTGFCLGGNAHTISAMIRLRHLATRRLLAALAGLLFACAFVASGSSASGSIDLRTLASRNIGGISTTFSYTPTSCTASYGDGTIAETYYHAGPRSSVTGPDGDARSFSYQHLELAKETHAGGVWGGWTVEWLPDTKGRLQTLRISGGGNVRSFSYGYDGNSRLASSGTPELTATYSRNANGQAASLVRGNTSMGWNYDSLGRLAGVSNTGLTNAPSYTYSNYDGRNRIGTRTASRGRVGRDCNMIARIT